MPSVDGRMMIKGLVAMPKEASVYEWGLYPHKVVGLTASQSCLGMQNIEVGRWE